MPYIDEQGRPELVAPDWFLGEPARPRLPERATTDEPQPAPGEDDAAAVPVGASKSR